MKHREQCVQRPEDTKALVRRAAITLVRMREMTRDVASKDAVSAKCVSHCVL